MKRDGLIEQAAYIRVEQDDQSPDAERQSETTAARIYARNHGENAGRHREPIGSQLSHLERPIYGHDGRSDRDHKERNRQDQGRISSLDRKRVPSLVHEAVRQIESVAYDLKHLKQ